MLGSSSLANLEVEILRLRDRGLGYSYVGVRCSALSLMVEFEDM